MSQVTAFPGSERYSLDDASGCWLPAAGAQSFAYSDGADVEQRLFKIVRCAWDRSVLSEELRAAITDWPSRYHLSPRRANLLRPIEAALKGRHVLEVGAGCGAISRYLGECGAEVVALEGSFARAKVAAARCHELDNVKVLVDGFHALPAAPEFDVVCLIGVLEYARVFFPAQGGDAVDAMLVHAVKFLRPGGHLVLAIENQLGLKYFAGYREDHVGQAMFGIEDLYAPDGVVTFGRQELARRLHAAGLAELEWLYPFPDYKLPVSVLTEPGAACVEPDLAPILSSSVVADPQEAEYFRFSLEQAWQTVQRNGLAGELANSFLVLASTCARPASSEAVLAYHYACERRRAFNKAVSIVAEADGVKVRSTLLDTSALQPVGPLRLRLGDTSFTRGAHWQAALFHCLNRPGWRVEEVAHWAHFWLDAVAARVGLAPSGLHLAASIPGEMIDAVPRNLILGESGPTFIDLEWVLERDVELGHLLFRGLVSSLLSISSVARPAPDTPLDLLHLFVAVARGAGLEYPDARLVDDFAREAEFQTLAAGSCWAGFEALACYRLPVRPELRPEGVPEQANTAAPEPGNRWRRRLDHWLRRGAPHC